MITITEIEKLAELSRIELATHEKEALRGQFDAILGYVDQIKQVTNATVIPVVGDLRNVMRPDTNPHESGIHTEAILANAPAREGNYLKVKKIL